MILLTWGALEDACWNKELRALREEGGSLEDFMDEYRPRRPLSENDAGTYGYA